MKYILGMVVFFLMFTFEEYRIAQRDMKIKRLEWAQSKPEDSIEFNCVKCNTLNKRSLFQYSDSIERDSTKIFKNIPDTLRK